MADLEKTVKIIFAGDDSELAKTTSSLAGRFDGLNTVAGNVVAPFASAADAILKVDAALAALVAGGLALAISRSGDFNKQFALISTSVDATGSSLTKYRDDVLGYATTSVKSMDDINGALYTAAQAGIKWGDSLEFMGSAEKLAVANNANLNTTVDLLTGTMNAYGYKLSDVSHLTDVFFQSTLIGKQTIDDLGQSMGLIVGIAATSGVSFEQLSAAISTLTAKGMQTAEAITAVKGVITSFISPSKEAADAARSMGLNFSASTLQSKGFATMMEEVMRATGGSADKLTQLFGDVRALNGAMMLTGDSMKFFNDAVRSIEGSAGAAQAAYEKMVNTFSNQAQQIKNTFNVLLVDIGTKVEPIAGEVGKGISAVLAGLDKSVRAGAFDSLFAALGEFGAKVGTFLTTVAQNLPAAFAKVDFSGLLKSVGDLGAAFGDWFSSLDFTTVDGLAAAIQKAVDIVTGFIEVTASMVEQFKPIVTAIADFFLTAAKGDEETKKTVGTILALAKAVEMAGFALVGAVTAIDQYKLSISGLFNVVVGGAQIMWNGFQLIIDAAAGAFGVLGGLFIELLDTLSFGLFTDKLAGSKKAIEDWGKSVSRSIMTDGEDAGRGLERLQAGFAQLSGTAGETGEAVAATTRKIGDIPEKKTTTWDFQGGAEMRDQLTALGKEIVVKGRVDSAGLKAELAAAVPAEQHVVVGYWEDEAGRHEITKRIEAAVPAKKDVKVEIQTDLAKIKEQSAVIQKGIEWTAKLNIAQVEEGTKRLKDMLTSVDSGIKSTGDLLGDLFGNLGTALGSERRQIEDQINLENQRRQQEFDLQRKLLEQQLKLNELKMDKLRTGSNQIELTMSGIQPHLEMIMWEILEAIQVRANEEAAEFLLGI